MIVRNKTCSGKKPTKVSTLHPVQWGNWQLYQGAQGAPTPTHHHPREIGIAKQERDIQLVDRCENNNILSSTPIVW